MTKITSLTQLWFRLPQQIRFIFVGGYNTLVGYILFIIALYFLGEDLYQVALLISYILSSVNSYLAQKFFVFSTIGNYIKEYFKALSVWLLGYFINAAILHFMIEKFSLNTYIAQAISICCVTIITYILFKYYSFRRAVK